MQAHDQVIARLVPTDRGIIRPEVVPWIGQIDVFTAAWYIEADDRPEYDGDWAMRTPDGWPIAWVESSSLEILATV